MAVYPIYHFQKPSTLSVDTHTHNYFEEDEGCILDNNTFDPSSGLEMSPSINNSRRDSFALSSPLFSPKAEEWDVDIQPMSSNNPFIRHKTNPNNPFMRDASHSSIFSYQPIPKRMRPHSPPLHSYPDTMRRGDGIRRKNARFDIPPNRNLNNIDQLIAQSTDEQEIKELKQQKRLLRNRQAALDSRQRKKRHTEQLEESANQNGKQTEEIEREYMAWQKLLLEVNARLPRRELDEKCIGNNDRRYPSGSNFNFPKPENRRKVLRILINKAEHLACPDSGSEKNIMSEVFAKDLNLEIFRRPKDLKKFQLGSGKYVWSAGRVRVPVELLGKTFGGKKCWFYVFRTCPVPLILGMSFLREAEILTKNQHMLESCPDEWSNISSLLWIGSPRNRLKCSLNGHELEAVADTGSDLNIISLKCAKREGFQIDRRREARRRIRTGDGTVVETIGQVYIYSLSLDWRKAESSLPKDQLSPLLPPLPLSSSDYTENPSPLSEDTTILSAIFHVLPGLPCDLIFGRDLLDQTDAFNLCPDLLSPRSTNKNSSFELNVLISLGAVFDVFPRGRKHRQSPTTNASPKEIHDNAWHAEVFRRTKREEEILLLPVGEQEQAKAREREKKKVWDAFHRTCLYCHSK